MAVFGLFRAIYLQGASQIVTDSHGFAMATWKKIADNIYFCGDGNRAKPYLWKQAIDGKQYRIFFEDLIAAKNARAAKMEALRKYGALAHEFDRRAYLEWRAARDLIPDNVSLVDVAADWAERTKPIVEKGMTVESAYRRFLESKTCDLIKAKKNPLSKEHLADLKWRSRVLIARFGHLPPAQVSGRQLVELYRDSKNSGRSILNQHDSLRNFFNWCKRSGLVTRSPYEDVRAEDLPDCPPSAKHPLELWRVVRLMIFFEAHYPYYIPWLALRLFVGIRTKEAARFDPEWINRERGFIRMPGWVTAVNGSPTAGTKTRDDWAIFDIAPNFWAWIDAYPPEAGAKKLRHPVDKTWRRIRDEIIAAGIVDGFGSNAFRDTFCTFNFSADLDPVATAAKMKHRSPAMMFQSYLGALRPRWEGRAFRGIYPGARGLGDSKIGRF